MDKINFNGVKPPKDWDERKKLTIDQLSETGSIITANLKVVGGSIKETTSTASVVIANKSSELK